MKSFFRIVCLAMTASVGFGCDLFKPPPVARTHSRAREAKADPVEAPSVRAIPMYYDVEVPACEPADLANVTPLEVEQICDHYVDAYCRAHLDQACCLGAPHYYDEALVNRCKTDKKRLCLSNLTAGPHREGRIRVNLAKASRVLREYECQAFRCQPGIDFFERAREFLEGTVAAGGMCGHGIDSYVCKAGTRCLLDYRPDMPAAERLPTCVREIPEGAECRTRRDVCAVGHFCQPTVRDESGEPDFANAMTFDLPGRCVRALPNGQPCPRAADDGDHYCASHLCRDDKCQSGLPRADLYCLALADAMRWR